MAWAPSVLTLAGQKATTETPRPAQFLGEAEGEPLDSGLDHAVDRVVGEGEVLGGIGADVDDDTAALARHGRDGGAAAEEGPADVERDNTIEAAHGVALDGGEGPRSPGVVHEEVDPPELIERPLEEGVDASLVGDVAGDSDGLASGGLDAGGGLADGAEKARARLDAAGGDYHGGPLTPKDGGDSLANAPAGAGDDGHVAGEPSHGRSMPGFAARG